MVLAQVGDGGNAIQEGHVDVDHDCVRIELLGLLDRLEPVCRETHYAQFRLAVDQLAQGVQECSVVVCQ